MNAENANVAPHQAAPTNQDGKFRIFRPREGAELSSDIMTMTITAQDQAGLRQVAAAGYAEGAVVKTLFAGETAGVSLVCSWFKANFPLPRHSHNADCLYYLISGAAHLGTEILQAGDGFFVPADGLYAYTAGPDGVEILEFRTAAHFDFKPSANPASWSRLAGLAAANRDAWRAQAPPPAARRFTPPS